MTAVHLCSFNHVSLNLDLCGSFTNKTDCHDIIEILLKVALNTIKQTKQDNIILTLISILYGKT